MLRKVGVKSWFFSSFVLRNASGLIAFFTTSGTRYKFWSSAYWEARLQSQHPSRPLLMRCRKKWSPLIGCIPIVSPPPTVLHPGSKVTVTSVCQMPKLGMLWRGEICRSLNWIALRAKETFNWKRRSQKSGEHITVWRISNKMQMWWRAASENATSIYTISESSIQTEFSFAVCIYFCLNRHAVYIFLLCFYPSVISSSVHRHDWHSWS